MRLEQLKYLVEIAKTNSMSMAAENLHIAQSSLSLSIKQLEDELNTVIFIRSKKGSFLTEKGEDIYRKACQILEIAQSLYSDKNAETKNRSENINLLSVAVFNPTISKIIINMMNNDIKIQQKTTILNAENINHIIPDLQHHYDFILTTISSKQLHLHLTQLLQHYHVYLISDSNISVMTSQYSSYATLKTISLSQLKRLPLIQYSSDETTDEFLCSIVEQFYNINLNTTMMTNDINSISRYIESGSVVSLTTPFIQRGTHYTLSTDNAILIPLKDKITVSFILLRRKDNKATVAQQLFFEMFSDCYPQMKELT